jgi:dihydrofolate synthase/folylpolyglutamate synthase
VRIEVISTRPTVIVDAAHNWAATEALLQTLEAWPASLSGRRLLVFSGTQDKDVAGLLRLLVPNFDTIILTQYQSNPRAVDVRQLARMAEAVCPYPVFTAPDPAAAWKLASRLAGEEDLICVTGSFFIAAEIRELLVDERNTETGGVSPAPVAARLKPHGR